MNTLTSASHIAHGHTLHARRPLNLAAGQVDRMNLPVPNLSAREREVLRLWLLCDSKVEVGRQMYLAIGTVNTHLTRIRAKYAAVGRPAQTKAALVARALQDGILRLDEL